VPSLLGTGGCAVHVAVVGEAVEGVGVSSIAVGAAGGAPARGGVVSEPRPFEARRGDDVAAWIKRQRDEQVEQSATWFALDDLLDTYRLHADTGTPLTQQAEEGWAR
jgi:hypothetical protein